MFRIGEFEQVAKARVKALQAEAEVVRLLPRKSLRRRLAERLVGLARRLDSQVPLSPEVARG